MVCSKSSRKPVGTKRKKAQFFQISQIISAIFVHSLKEKIKALKLKMDELFIANNVAIKHRLLVT